MTQVFHKPVLVTFPEHVDQDAFWSFVNKSMVGKTELVMQKQRELLATVASDEVKVIGGVNFIPCLFVSYRDASVVAEVKKDTNGKRKVNVANKGIKAQVMDFNFVLISKENGMAVYQSYRSAASPTVFEEMLRKIFFQFKKTYEQAEIDQIDEKLKKTKKEIAKRAVTKKWRQMPEVTIICDQENSLAKVLSEWKEVNSFTYRLATFAQAGSSWQPLSKIVKLQTQTVTFIPLTSPKDVVKAILPIKGELKSGSFHGVDDTKAKRSLDIFELARNLAAFDFKDLEVKLDGLVLEDFYKSSVFKWLEDSILPRLADFRDPINEE